MKAAPLAALVLAFALEAQASALTVEVVNDPSMGETVRVVAEEGEANRVTVSEEELPGRRNRITVRETSAPIVAGSGCVFVDAQTVRCDSQQPNDQTDVNVLLGDEADEAQIGPGFDLLRLVLFVNAGEGADTVHADGQAHTVFGGADADRLTGGAAAQSFYGGPGDDFIDAGEGRDYARGDAGNDEVHGGAGRDRLEGGLVNVGEVLGSDRLYGEDGDDELNDFDTFNGQLGGDMLDGGPGSDTVESYRDSRQPVRVDLARTTGQGHAGENDVLVAIENVRGGSAADTLLGNDDANRIYQPRGGDVVMGRGGDDELAVSGSGSVSGGAGDDEIQMWPTFDGRVACDSGDDQIHFGPFFDGPFPGFPDPRARGMFVRRDCEAMRYRRFEWAAIPRRTRKRIVFTFSSFTCCRATLRLSQARSGSRLGTRRIRSRRVRFRYDRRRRSTLRAVFRPRPDIPIVWRFRR